MTRGSEKGVKAIDEARKLDLRPLLIVAAVAAVIATLWATVAFAAGGSSQGDSSGNAPSSFVQDEQNRPAPSDRDCPEGRGGPGQTGPSDSGGSGSADL
jgi:hypothetical protein